MFFYLVQVSLFPISSTAIELSSGDFVETSNQTATQRPEVSLENTPVEVVEEKRKMKLKPETEVKRYSTVAYFHVPLKDESLNSRSISISNIIFFTASAG